jgi:hypothetical protein
MKIRIAVITLFCVLTAWAGLASAQTLSHYPAGAEGIKGPSLPPPGVYFRDYNYIYFSDSLAGGPPNFNVLAYVQVPRLIWISKYKLFGGSYGADIIVPFAYQRLDAGSFSGSDFSLADIFVEPITLSWHQKQFDVALGYGFWAPSGDYSQADPVSPGKGFWTQMFTAGATYYPDKAKSWSLAALNRYEISNEQKNTRITPSQYWTLDWGIGKSVKKTIEIGLAGYYQMATSAASGIGAPQRKDRAAGLGPEITLVCPKLSLSTSIRYMPEVSAYGRSKGSTITLIFTRRF